MLIDKWSESLVTIDVAGHDVEDLLLLIDWTSKNGVYYNLSVPVQKSSGSVLEFTIAINCTNLQAYEIREMWRKYQEKKGV